MIKKRRRQFITDLGLIGLTAIIPEKLICSPSVKGSVDYDVPVMKCKPYLQTSFKNSITIRWLTNYNCFGWVEIGEHKNDQFKKIYNNEGGLLQSNTTLHEITIDDLNPKKTYYYRVKSKVIIDFDPYDVLYGKTDSSDIYSFKIYSWKDSDSISFSIFNDVHERPETFKTFSKFLRERNNFVLLNGDIFNWLESENQIINNLISPLNSYFKTYSTPIVYSRGNHETRGGFARHLKDYFNGSNDKFYYSFRVGPIYIIILDSGEDKKDSHHEYSGLVDFDSYRQEQANWLKEEVLKKDFIDSPYKIAFSHIPLFYANEHHGTLNCRELWNPILNKANIDLMVSGHTHHFGIYESNKLHNYPIIIGGGKSDGTRTIINIKCNSKKLELQVFNEKNEKIGSILL